MDTSMFTQMISQLGSAEDNETQIAISFLEMFIVIQEFKTLLEIYKNTPEMFSSGDEAIETLHQKFSALLEKYPSFLHHTKFMSLLPDSNF